MGVLEKCSHTWKELNARHRKLSCMKSHIVGKLHLLPGDSSPGSVYLQIIIIYILFLKDRTAHARPSPVWWIAHGHASYWASLCRQSFFFNFCSVLTTAVTILLQPRINLTHLCESHSQVKGGDQSQNLKLTVKYIFHDKRKTFWNWTITSDVKFLMWNRKCFQNTGGSQIYLHTTSIWRGNTAVCIRQPHN